MPSLIGTIADWRTYAAARGNDAPTNATDELATEALWRASDYVYYTYVQRFTAGYDETADNVEEAVYEAANFELSTPGFFSKTFTKAQQRVLTKVDQISWSPVGKSRGNTLSFTPQLTKIQHMLAPYLPAEDEDKTAPYISALNPQPTD